MTEKLCPCGSNLNTVECCLPLIKGKAKAKTAEQLMRSRYTAFVLGQIDYIIRTHHSKTVAEVDRPGIEEWSKKSKWLGLKILDTSAGQEADQQGTVTFHVQYEADGKTHDHREHSLFEKENGEWRFLDAEPAKTETIRREEPKVGRNDPCPCGSGKKFKKCCA
ncbi:MAG: YchJ family protein [Bdellovibrionales bacterium]|nr:YchJ family protein [Bdellovibrionales bacterium]